MSDSIVYVRRPGLPIVTHAARVETTARGRHFAVCTCGWMQRGESSKVDDANVQGRGHLERVIYANRVRWRPNGR